jgi:hypothetical protein
MMKERLELVLRDLFYTITNEAPLQTDNAAAPAGADVAASDGRRGGDGGNVSASATPAQRAAAAR